MLIPKRKGLDEIIAKYSLDEMRFTFEIYTPPLNTFLNKSICVTKLTL